MNEKMWYYYLIGLGILLGLIALFILISTRHNKYFFWNWPLFVDDRNGVRKPGKKPEVIFGDDPTIRHEIIPEIMKDIQMNAEQMKETNFEVVINEDTKTFDILFDDVVLEDGGLRIWSHGQKYTSYPEEIDPENELKALPLKIKSVNQEDGKNYFGEYHDYLISWYSVDRDVLILTTIRHYKDPSCLMFRIEFPGGLENTKRKTYKQQSIQFPIFKNQSNRSLIFTYDQVNFSEPRDKFVETSAPIVFYNESLETFIISPTMNFLIAMNTPNKDTNEIRMGIEGEIKNIPEGFIHETMLYADRGVPKTMEHWGDLMLKYYQKDRLPNDADQVLSYLGYWTDAGTYYYYNHEPFDNYEECLLAVKKKADELEIPYGYFQLDSWFYPKEDGTVKWDGRESIFPHGLRGFIEQLKLPVVCHNRWFSENNIYQTQFDGWIKETHPKTVRPSWDPRAGRDEDMRTWSLPTNKEFWDFLMTNAHSWGCIAYEQDWLQPQWRFFDYLKEDVYNGRRWLNDMAEAAMNYDMSVQYCMTFPSFYMATLELPNVTHARCSDDYNHRKPKRIYIPHFTQTSMLSWAVGVWPWKDPFYSTCIPKEGTISLWEKTPAHYEQYPRLELLLQVLSGGPVGNGDKVELINKDLLMESCREDGYLLKPDRPAFPVDLMFLPHKKPYIASTYSNILGEKWWYLLMVDVWQDGIEEKWITPKELGLTREYVVYDYVEKKLFKAEGNTKIGPSGLQEDKKRYDYKFYVLAPVLANGMAFIGFRDKIATMSSKTFDTVMVTKDSLKIQGNYIPFKEFSIVAYVPNKPEKVVVDGTETEHYTWGPNYKTLTIILKPDKEEFTIEITA